MAHQGIDKEISLGGIVRNTSGSVCPDGEMEELINLRPKDGSFRPTGESMPVRGLEDVKVDYTNIVVHSCGYRHLLGVKDGRLYYFANQDETNTVSMLTIPIELMDVSGEPKYSQTGNLLSVIDDTGIKYLLWEGNKYKEASMDFNGSPTDTVVAPLDVSFRMTPEMGKDEDNIDRQIIHAYVEQVFKKDGLGSFELHKDIAARNELFVPKYLEALYRHREKGYPVGYFFICAVAELYDGTKVLQTNPQLITIGNDKGTRYYQDTQGESYNGSLESHQGTWAAEFGKKKRLYKWGCIAGDPDAFIYYNTHDAIDKSIRESDRRYHREILSGSDNFSYYYKYHHRYSYGGYGSKTNGLLQLCPNTDINWINPDEIVGARDPHYGYLGYTGYDKGRSQPYCPKIVEDLPYVWSSLVHNNFGVFFPASKLQYRINGVKNLDNTLFRKIHFYITEPIEPVKSHSLSDVFYTLMTEREDYNDGNIATAKLTTFEFNELTQKELEHSLLNQKIFYKIKELEFSDVKKGGWIDLEFKDNILNNLKTNCEQLNLDAINRSSFVPKVAYSYNGRLHLANYSENLFSGYPINYFFDERPSEANTQYAPYKTFFNFPIQNHDDEFEKSKAYMKIVVHLKTEDGYKQVTRYRTLYGNNTFINNISVGYPYSDLMPFICYPDRRAERLDVYVVTEDGQADRFFDAFYLTPHAYWDMAYYINEWFKPINCLPEHYYPHPESYSTDDLFDIPTTNELSSVTYGNKIRVSAVDNPIYFPYKNTYQIGNAEILALSSNTIALSEGQVGDAPLIVFASDGIYGLFVDATGQMTYTNSRPLARDILNNAKSVTPTDFGVVFTTDRGLMIISGVEVQEMSEKVEGDFFDFTNAESFDYLAVGKNAVSHKELVLLSDSVTKTEFKQYISGAKIGYNFNEYEIVLSNNNYSYSYIYSLRYKLWYKRTGSASEFVNDYPNMYFLDNGTLYDINRDDTTKSTQTMFLSRPIKFNTQDFKQAFRSIIRGLFHLPKKENSGNIHELVVTSDDLTPTVRDIVLTEKAFDKTITLTPFECTFREIELVAPTLSKSNYASGEVDTHTFEEVDGVITPSSVRLYVDSCYTIIKGSDEKRIVNTGLHNPVIMEQLEVTVIDDFSDISSPNDGDMFIMQTSLLRWEFNDIIDCYYKDFTYHLTNEGATHDEGTYHWYNNEKKMYQVVNSVEVEVQMDNSSYWKDGDLFYQFYQPNYIDMSYEEIISAVNDETLETYSPIEPGGGEVTSLRLTKGNCYKVVKYNTTNTKETYTFKFTGTTNLYPIIDVLSVLSGINTNSPLVGSFIDVPLYASETITGLTNGECVRIKTNGATVCEFIYSSNATSINNLTLLDNYRSGIYDEIPPVADVENLVVNGKLLLKSGENVFITDETGDTPIVYKFVYYGEYGIYYYDLMMRIGLNMFDEIHPIGHTPIELKQDEYIHLSVSYNNGAEREAYFKYLITESPIPLDDLLSLIDTNSTSEVLVYSSPSAIPLNTDKLLRIVCGKTIIFRDVNNNEYLFSAKKGNNKSFFRSYANLLYILQNHCTPSGYLDTSGVLWKTEEDAGLKYRAGIYLFGSYDCRKWTYIGGNERGKISGINGVPENSEENINDVYNVRFRDLGALTERVDFKFFRILFVGNLIGDSSIEYIDMSVSGRLLSQKLR